MDASSTKELTMTRDVLFLFLGVVALACLIGLFFLLFGRRAGARRPDTEPEDRSTSRGTPRA
jgi:hypothetical protein